MILLLETSTEICSVALTKENDIVASRMISEPNSHSQKLSLLIQTIEVTNKRIVKVLITVNDELEEE